MSGLGPPILNSSMRSWNWPWMSPQTVTGHFYWLSASWPGKGHHWRERDNHQLTTGWTLDSSCRTSRAYLGMQVSFLSLRRSREKTLHSRRANIVGQPARRLMSASRQHRGGEKIQTDGAMPKFKHKMALPCRKVSGRRPRRAACSSSSSQSIRRGWEWWQARSEQATRRRVPFPRPPCWYPWRVSGLDVMASRRW